jgi:hypothetical protein
MPCFIAPRFHSAALVALLALGACSGGGDNNLSAIDNELLANGADPALTSALEDQILVDPNLVQQAHPNTVRPPETPVQAQYPAGSATAQPAAGSAGAAANGACGGPFQYGAQWAGRLPAEFPAYPGGRITEAAGNDGGRCRVVTFTTGDRFDRVLDFYRGVAGRAGFTAEHLQRGGDHVLGGVNTGTDGAYYLVVTPRPNGSEVALIVNNGR